jgi:hypothetical protein
MAPTFQEIREGLATNLASIPNVQVSAYVLGNPTMPAIEVVPGWEGRDGIDYDKTFRRGLDALVFTVRAMVGTPTDIGAQKRLDRMISPTGEDSIKAAVEADGTLGGVVEDLHVTSCSGYKAFARDGGTVALGANWRVEVWAEGV